MKELQGVSTAEFGEAAALRHPLEPLSAEEILAVIRVLV
jgi:hypothetical protein